MNRLKSTDFKRYTQVNSKCEFQDVRANHEQAAFFLLMAASLKTDVTMSIFCSDIPKELV